MYDKTMKTADAGRQQTEIEQVCHTLSCHNEMLGSILHRLESMRTRIFGPIPEDGADGIKAPTPGGVQLALRGTLGAQRDMLDSSTKLLSEIEKFS